MSTPRRVFLNGALSRKLITGACVLVLALGLVLAFLQFSMEQVAFSPGFYQRQFDALNAEERTGMSREDLDEAARRTRGFLAGERADLYLAVEVHGEERPLYTPRELVHLEDVRELFQAGRRAALAGALGALAALAGLAGLGPSWWLGAVRGLKSGARLGLVILIAAGVIMSLDFEGWFLWFHLVAFDNDFWILAPERHLMISMFPQPFFAAAAQAVALRTVGGLMLLAAGAWVLERFGQKRTREVQ